MNLITNNTSTKPIIIACDHGYGQIKTAHAVFKTGVTAYDKEPTFKSNMLVYQDRYYIIGDICLSPPTRKATFLFFLC